MNKMPQDNFVKIAEITPEQVASICDHTFLLRPESYREKGISSVKKWQEEFDKFLKESVSFPTDPYALCVRPETVRYSRQFLAENQKYNQKIASVVGFPQGSFYELKWKLMETELAVEAGADEIDFVINYDNFHAGSKRYLEFEMGSLASACEEKKVKSKAILETSELADSEIIVACQLAQDSGIDFVKTSSGFTDGGATAHHLKLMRDNFPNGVKMSGGVTPENLKELLYAASGRTDRYIDLNPLKIRIGESSLLTKLFSNKEKDTGY
jgi:deoxyribose-phosphate aldolase